MLEEDNNYHILFNLILTYIDREIDRGRINEKYRVFLIGKCAEVCSSGIIFNGDYDKITKIAENMFLEYPRVIKK